jgi:hypothetical protein
VGESPDGALQVDFDIHDPIITSDAGGDGLPGKIGPQGSEISPQDNLTAQQNREGIYPTREGTKAKRCQMKGS